VLLVLSVLAGACTRSPQEHLRPLPDLSGPALEKADPEIREQILEALARAEAQPHEAAAAGRLGAVLQAYEFSSLSIPCFQRARLLDPAAFEWAYYLAVAHAALGHDHDAVIALLRETLRLQPDYWPARLKLAEALLAAGGSEDSQTFIEDLLQRAPQSARVQYLAGRAKEAGGDVAAAATHYAQACTLAPRYGAARYALAAAYRRLGKPAEAQQHLVRYAAHPNSVPPLEDPLLDSLETLKAGASRHLGEGRRLMDQGRLAESRKEYEAALKINPRLAQAHASLISICGQLGDLKQAEAHYQAAVEINPELAEAHHNYGVALSSQPRRLAEAAGAFRKALEVNPRSADALNNLGSLAERQGRLQEAEARYREALEAEPGHREAHFNVARLLRDRSDWKKAAEHLRQTLHVEDDRTPLMLYILADTYLQLGDLTQALEHARQARLRAASYGQQELTRLLDARLRELSARAESGASGVIRQ
jgi:tetratricopeptide (TPR) repeat protein